MNLNHRDTSSEVGTENRTDFSRRFVIPLFKLASTATKDQLGRIISLLTKTPEIKKAIEVTKKPKTREGYTASERKKTEEQKVEQKSYLDVMTESLLSTVTKKLDQLVESQKVTVDQMDQITQLFQNVCKGEYQRIDASVGNMPMSLYQDFQMLKIMQNSLSEGKFFKGVSNLVDPTTNQLTDEFLLKSASLMSEYPLFKLSPIEINESVLENFDKSTYNQLFFDNLSLTNPKLAAEYLNYALQNFPYLISTESVYKALPLLAQDSDAFTLLPLGYQEFALKIMSYEMPIKVYEKITTELTNLAIFPPINQAFLSNLDTVFSDPILKREFYNNSPYIDYLPSLLNDISLIDEVRSKIEQSQVSFLSAVETRIIDQIDNLRLLEKMSIVNQEFKSPIQEVLLQRDSVISIVKSIYQTTQEHSGVSQAVELFRSTHENDLLVRATNFKHLDSILRTGCYAQEMLPFLARDNPNAMAGFLNSVSIKATPTDALTYITTNTDLISYGGDQPCVLIFAPSDEAAQRTGVHVGQMAIGDGHALTLGGLSTSELAGIVLFDTAAIDTTKQSLIDQEKYIPLFDSEKKIVFTQAEYESALDSKKFGSIAGFLADPPIEFLKDQDSGHLQGGNLFEHTMRVVNESGKYKLDSRKIDLLHVAATVHDIAKNESVIGSQSLKNVEAAIPYLDEIRGLKQNEKTLILKAISVDEKIGQIIENFSPSSTPENIEQTKKIIRSLFDTDEEMYFCLDLYLSDVLGIGAGQEAIDWKVEEKLTLLGLHYSQLAQL